jgi:citrate/tricarballylate utilization protein
MSDLIQDARRQVEICNACRYCEGYCSVFPALMRQRAFSDGDITQFANLCHNCRGCYYACQYTAPHEFDLNLPQILAEVRVESWADYAWPRSAAQMFQRSGVAVCVVLLSGLTALFLLAGALRPAGGTGFYAILSHTVMVALFLPAFLLPLISVAIGLRRYWRDVGGQRIQIRDIRTALAQIAQMKNLSGGQDQGCNFEDTDRYSNARRYAHQAVMWGFLLCFASTSSGTIMHYMFDLKAPYGLISLPKILGLTGGVLLMVGCIWMIALKLQADPQLGAARHWGGEIGFVLLLGFVSFSGLILYAATGTGWIGILLPLHLGAVLAFFLITPYSKMTHGFFRTAALIRDAQNQRP